MPALQVRDLPDDLYESLKACAARDHRSLAQEAVAAIEAFVGAPSSVGGRLRVVEPGERHGGGDVPRRRQAAFERIRGRGAWNLPNEFDDAAALVRAVREERDGRLDGWGAGEGSR